MSYDTWRIPDPAFQPEFYADVSTKRLFAWLIDSAVILLLCVLVLPFTFFTGIFFFPFLFLMIGLAYRVVLLTQGSATLGMRILAIEFRNHDGTKFDLWSAALHSTGFTVSCVFLPLQVLSCVLMLTTARSQGLTDHVLGTVAINLRANG